MSRMLGYYDSDELDRPDLNKCPDCGCFFATDECPLCGKLCPEEMRAGRRAKVKPPKKRSSSSGRVQFIAWYHSWWFILLMVYLMPVAGIILFFTSPHSKKSKIIAASAVVGGYLLLTALSVGAGLLLDCREAPSLVNDDIPKAEYVERCASMSVEEFHRDAYNEGNFVTLELTVERVLTEDGERYYLCRDRNGGELEVLLLDCSLEQKPNYLKGDIIRVYGECAGYTDPYVGDVEFSDMPCLYVAYSELIG